MAYFGNNIIGLSSASTANFVCCKFIAPANGTISSITYYVAAASGTVDCGCAIYSDSSGTPLNLLASDSGNVTVNTTPQWVTVNISLQVTAGTTYWLTRWTSGSSTLYWTQGATDQYYVQGAVFENWPNPESGSGTKFARAVSIYATYNTTPTSTPASWVGM